MSWRRSGERPFALDWNPEQVERTPDRGPDVDLVADNPQALGFATGRKSVIRRMRIPNRTANKDVESFPKGRSDQKVLTDNLEDVEFTLWTKFDWTVWFFAIKAVELGLASGRCLKQKPRTEPRRREGSICRTTGMTLLRRGFIKIADKATTLFPNRGTIAVKEKLVQTMTSVDDFSSSVNQNVNDLFRVRTKIYLAEPQLSVDHSRVIANKTIANIQSFLYFVRSNPGYLTKLVVVPEHDIAAAFQRDKLVKTVVAVEFAGV